MQQNNDVYMGKWLTGLLYLATGGLVGIGYIYDLWMLNDQISLANGSERLEMRR